jgi:hypothetical protein
MQCCKTIVKKYVSKTQFKKGAETEQLEESTPK